MNDVLHSAHTKKVLQNVSHKMLPSILQNETYVKLSAALERHILNGLIRLLVIRRVVSANDETPALLR